jgi:hypothetical protein
MLTVKVRPIEFQGRCAAGLIEEDEFQVSGVRLLIPRGSSICFLALSHLAPVIRQLQSESRLFVHAACPGCPSPLNPENRVTFLLGQAEKWELCRTISAYQRVIRPSNELEAALGTAPETAPGPDAWVGPLAPRERGESSGAEQRIRTVIEELRRVANL